MPRATKSEREKRVSTVIDKLLAGESRRAIVQYGTKAWTVTPRAVDKYIASANDAILQAASWKRDSAVALHQQRLENLYRLAFAKNDWSTCLRTLAQLGELQGLNPPKELRHLLQLSNSDMALFTQLLTRLEAQQIPASELFEALLMELAEREQTS